MYIVSPVNNKGGVGKTTIAKTLCEYFAKVCKKTTLAIDMDHQCNLSNRFLDMEIDANVKEGKLPTLHPDYQTGTPLYPDWDGRCSIADIFFGKPLLPYPTYIEKLDIIPAHTSLLLAAERVRKDEVTEKVHNQLMKFLSLEEVKQEYDVVVIDTPPSKGPLTTSVIRAATDIVIPAVMEPQPIEGIYGMLQLWKQEQLRRDKSIPLNLIGILANMFNTRSNLHKGLFTGLQSNAAISNYVLEAKLARRIAFAEVDAEGAEPQSIFDLPETNQAKVEALQVCELIQQRMLTHG